MQIKPRPFVLCSLIVRYARVYMRMRLRLRLRYVCVLLFLVLGICLLVVAALVIVLIGFHFEHLFVIYHPTHTTQ